MIALNEKLDLPGLVDIHVHLREPGTNHAETIASGTRAALLGGYAVIGDMTNNQGRETWSEARLLEKHDIARATAYMPTTYHSGSQPSSDNVGELKKMIRWSLWLKLYGGITTSNPRDYEAIEFKDSVAEWHRLDPTKPIGFHAGQNNLEDMIGLVARDYKHPLHVHHVSSSREVKLIQAAKDRGLIVTSEVCPHHLIKTSHDVRSEGWFARVVPKLVKQDEAEKLMRYLDDDEIDIVATDHAPWSTANKFTAEAENPDGLHGEGLAICSGLPSIDHAAAILFYQAHRGFISFERLIDAMSTRPAEILGVKLAENTSATWDMREYRIGEDNVQSQSGWSPYMGKLAIGHVQTFDIGGQRLISAGEIVGRRPEVVTSRGTVI